MAFVPVWQPKAAVKCLTAVVQKVVSASALSDTQFPKRLRLRSQDEFKAVFQHYQRLSESSFAAAIRPNNLDHARLGLSIAKRHIKRSVDRNRLKRVIRETFRHRQANLASLDIVVMVKYPIADLTKAEVNACIQRLLQKVEQQLKQSSSA